jgi:hypothetical protein
MKELKEEAKRHHERKLHAYGGKCREHGGRVHHDHDDEKEDKKLIKEEVKEGALKHRAMGGALEMGGGKPPAMARHRGAKGPGKGGTKVNVNLIKGDGPSGPMPVPVPVGGAGPGPMPPRPAAPPVAAPRPPMAGPGGPGPMKRGGAAKKHRDGGKKHH